MNFRQITNQAKECKITIEEKLKENIVIPIRKEQIKWYNLTFMIKKANGKQRKRLDAEALNKQISDFDFKIYDSNEVKQTIRLGDFGTSLDHSPTFHYLIVQIESLPQLAFQFQNNHYAYRAMQFGTKRSLINFATVMESIMQQIRMKIEIRIINYVDDIHLLHQNKQYMKNMSQKVIASFFLNTMDHQKALAARLRGWSTTMIMNKTAIPDINWWVAKFRAIIPALSIQISPQISMATDAAASGRGSTLKKELETIAVAHGTWNKRQAKLTRNNREIKAITQGL
ncbi:MAG: hypothetical protein EZS28_001304 [Streblomastix strix]|uniref:Reverse transcriptase domain-containing protein n=1 Tax=Streblomastix strix TaxID=222440 RepID=A0A5J4X7G7_9EUKA|nr:MAG: hypothetical protein EZS28_001304 [Streblomastix strix]